MQQIALSHRLHHQGVFIGGLAAEAGASTTCAAIGVSSSRSCSGEGVEGGAHPRASSSASPAASSVRSTLASLWASETNQASNWAGGG